MNQVNVPPRTSRKRRRETPAQRYKRLVEGYKTKISEMESEIQYLKNKIEENQVTLPEEYPSFKISPPNVDEEVLFSQLTLESDISSAEQLDVSLKKETQISNYGISISSNIDTIEHPVPRFVLPTEEDTDTSIANEDGSTKTEAGETAKDITAIGETSNANTTDIKTEDITYDKVLNMENKNSDEDEDEEGDSYTGAKRRFPELLCYAMSLSELKSEIQKENVFNAEYIKDYIKNECERYTEDIKDGLQVLCDTYIRNNTEGSVDERLLKGSLFGMVYMNLQSVLSFVHSRFLKRMKKNCSELKDSMLPSLSLFDNSDSEAVASILHALSMPLLNPMTSSDDD